MIMNHFRQLAAYNKWSNARLYAAALDLRVSRDRKHGFQTIVSTDFTAS
jgi:uncharacterized damage-inducible protein DinB